ISEQYFCGYWHGNGGGGFYKDSVVVTSAVEVTRGDKSDLEL
ncbi:hypothetical protein TNCT_154101, partial [Trichonephila clavata]